MRGDRASKYAEARMAECLDNGRWPVRHELEADFEKMFKPIADKEWAMKRLETFVQGTMKIDDFEVKWLMLAKQVDVEDRHSTQILKKNMKRSIIEEL